MTTVKSAASANHTVAANVNLSRHTSWQGGGSVNDCIVANRGEVMDINSVNITSNDTIVPD